MAVVSAQLGDLGVDVDGDGAEEVDVGVAGRPDVGQELVVDPGAAVAQAADGEAEEQIVDQDIRSTSVRPRFWLHVWSPGGANPVASSPP